MTRATGSLLAAVAALLVTALTLMPGARADTVTSPMEYSLDGQHWSATPPDSIFPASWRPVPGSSVTATLYLRSTRSENTIVGVYAGPTSSSSAALLAHTSLTSAGRKVPLTRHPGCVQVTPQRMLGHGQTMAVPLTLAIDPQLTTAQDATLSTDLELAFSDTGVTTLPGHCPVAPALVNAFPSPRPRPSPDSHPASPGARLASPGTLADTGSSISPWLPVAGALAVALGALVLVGSRTTHRKNRKDRTQP